MATKSQDEMVKLWASDTGDLRHILEGSTDIIHDMEFSPNNRFVAAIVPDCLVKIWAVDTGKLQHTFVCQETFVAEFSTDSRFVALTSQYTFEIRRPDTGELLRKFSVEGDIVDSVAFSSDGCFVAGVIHESLGPRTIITYHVRIWAIDTGYYETVNIGIDILPNIHFDPSNLLIITTDESSTEGLSEYWQKRGSSLFRWTRICVPSSELKKSPSSFLDYGPSTKNWITFSGTNILWLPSDCRPVAWAKMGLSIAFGTVTGRVLILRCKEDYDVFLSLLMPRDKIVGPESQC